MSADFSYNVEVTPLGTIPVSGPPGPSGPSAYAVAVAGGYVGTETEWVASLTGDSAYQIWLDAGNSGTETDFLAALVGDSAYEEWLDAGNSGSESAFLASLVGPPGPSAYEVWLQAGHSGSTDAFFAYITGPIGPSGDSAYTIAVKHGFVGSEAAWLASLKGASGTSAWSSLTGVPATFPPSPHIHPQTDVTGLVAALNSKAALSTTISTGSSITGGGALSGLATLTFVNDRPSPGPFQFYGTNNLGGRGWWQYGSAISANVPAAGDASTSQVVLGSDSRLTNARSPLAHALSHSFGASDPVHITKAQISDLPGIVTTALAGFVPPLPTTNPTSAYFRGDGTYAALNPGNFCAQVETPTGKSYTIDLAAASAYMIVRVSVVLRTGTCTVAFTQNGTAITGLGAIAVTTILQSITLSQPVNQNDLIALTVSAPSGAADLQYSMRYQK